MRLRAHGKWAQIPRYANTDISDECERLQAADYRYCENPDRLVGRRVLSKARILWASAVGFLSN